MQTKSLNSSDDEIRMRGEAIAASHYVTGAAHPRSLTLQKRYRRSAVWLITPPDPIKRHRTCPHSTSYFLPPTPHSHTM